MKQLVARSIAALAFTVFCLPAMAAQGFDPNRVFFGGGLSLNDVPGSDEGFGYQFFGGYEFGEVAKNISMDVEVGWMTTGDMFDGPGGEADGLWSTGVARLMMSPDMELLGRIGIDFGDDDGLMFGIGAGFHLNKQSTVRVEIVERDHVSSMQVNFVYRP